jgi:hypothetical protein
MAERREAYRYQLSLPIVVVVHANGCASAYAGQTREVSTKGIYFILEHPLDRGALADFTLTFPRDNKFGLIVRASGKISSVYCRDESGFGIGATIEQYVLAREKGNSAEIRIRDLD